MKTNDPAVIGIWKLYCEEHGVTDPAMNIEEHESEAQECDFNDEPELERSHE